MFTLRNVSQNGAYYYGDAYHQHVHDGTSADADYNLTCCSKTKLIAAKRALDADSVPISYVQLDDWWYVRGSSPASSHRQRRASSWSYCTT